MSARGGGRQVDSRQDRVKKRQPGINDRLRLAEAPYERLMIANIILGVVALAVLAYLVYVLLHADRD